MRVSDSGEYAPAVEVMGENKSIPGDGGTLSEGLDAPRAHRVEHRLGSDQRDGATHNAGDGAGEHTKRMKMKEFFKNNGAATVAGIILLIALGSGVGNPSGPGELSEEEQKAQVEAAAAETKAEEEKWKRLETKIDAAKTAASTDPSTEGLVTSEELATALTNLDAVTGEEIDAMLLSKKEKEELEITIADLETAKTTVDEENVGLRESLGTAQASLAAAISQLEATGGTFVPVGEEGDNDGEGESGDGDTADNNDGDDDTTTEDENTTCLFFWGRKDGKLRSRHNDCEEAKKNLPGVWEDEKAGTYIGSGIEYSDAVLEAPEGGGYLFCTSEALAELHTKCDDYTSHEVEECSRVKYEGRKNGVEVSCELKQDLPTPG